MFARLELRPGRATWRGVAPLRAALVAAALAATAAGAPVRAEGPGHMPHVELNIGVHLIHAELAANPADRELGLMFRRELGTNEGMLFDFVEPAQHCMWMRNTYLPLSVAFLDKAGAIINVEEMQAQTDATHCAVHPARYALEMPARWFAEHRVRPGTVIDGVVRAAPH